jgi:hypothetical protein
MRNQPEHVEQVLFMQRVSLDPRTRNVLITAVPNGGQRNKAVAGKLKAEGVRPGVPDILVFDPAPPSLFEGRSPIGLAIEMKVKPNKPTPLQLAWHAALVTRGWRCEVAYSAEEAWAILTSYLGVAP